MPNRILKDSICTSPNIDVLSRSAEVFFYRLLVQCDDFGRMDARTPILRAKCFPLQYEKATTADIDAWLCELQTAKLIAVYVVDDLPYLQMLTWEKHQQVRAKRSKYPPMQSHDINCNQMQSDDGIRLLNQSNPIQSESESNPIQSVVVVADPPADVGAVFSCWQDNMPGTMTQIVSDDLADLVTTYGPNEVIYGIGEAVRANVRTLRYVAGVCAKRQNGTPKPAANGNGKSNGYNGKVTNLDRTNQAFTQLEEMLAKESAA